MENSNKKDKVLTVITFIALLLSIGSITMLVMQHNESTKMESRIIELEEKLEQSINKYDSIDTMWAEIKRVEDKIVNPGEMVNEKIQNKVDEIQKKIENLNKMYDEITVKNTIIEDNVQTVQDDVQNVQDSVQTVQDQVDELDPNVDTSKK